VTKHLWCGAEPADLTWVEGVPRSRRFDDNYFSKEGGAQESRHVFLDGNELPERWRRRRHFTIVETGFGTGLNFLTTWDAWREDANRPDRLHFLSVEAFPLRQQDLGEALAAWPELADCADALLRAYPAPLPGLHRLLFEQGRICLDLILKPLEDALDILQDLPDLGVDSWYLDGFAPARNPAMWTDSLYVAMSRLSAPESRFATFTAAGAVRRGLREAGFVTEKVAGFGRKREMLRGTLATPLPPAAPGHTPWHLPRSDYPGAGAGDRRRASTGRDGERVLILGAGLAGACIADALARRGRNVAVYDAGEIAGGASGNRQGALYTRISHRPTSLNEFSLLSFSYASRFYRQLFDDGRLQSGRDGDLCGALHLHADWGPGDVLYETVNSLPGLVEYLDSVAAPQVSGLPGCPAGLFYPGSGWLSPAAVCRALLRRPGVALRENCGPLALQRRGEQWQLLDAQDSVLDSGGIAVVACGQVSHRVIDAQWLRLQAIRGQTSQLPSTGELGALKTVICHEGYLPPAADGEHCIGASFHIADPDSEPRAEDHRANIDQLRRALPTLSGLETVDYRNLTGRVGFRCASPDYLPVVGPVPDVGDFCSDYSALRRNARQIISHAGGYQQGLYLSTGHGSRGLTSTPLCAELLAAQIAAEPWPLTLELGRALAPARFLVRDLQRNRI
jgi:tRNA 5-methylaminomethyl-2-thiouridine biosynthesis bifunctional protein